LVAPDALFDGEVVPFDGVVPRGVTPVAVLYNLGRILDQLTAEEAVAVVEVHPQEVARVEQPVVVSGHTCGPTTLGMTHLAPVFHLREVPVDHEHRRQIDPWPRPAGTETFPPA
jgi:hypothetical protein